MYTGGPSRYGKALLMGDLQRQWRASIDDNLMTQYLINGRPKGKVTQLNTIATAHGGVIQVQGRDIWPTKIEMVADAKGGDTRMHVKMEFDAQITAAVVQARCPHPMG